MCIVKHNHIGACKTSTSASWSLRKHTSDPTKPLFQSVQSLCQLLDPTYQTCSVNETHRTRCFLYFERSTTNFLFFQPPSYLHKSTSYLRCIVGFIYGTLVIRPGLCFWVTRVFSWLPEYKQEEINMCNDWQRVQIYRSVQQWQSAVFMRGWVAHVWCNLWLWSLLYIQGAHKCAQLQGGFPMNWRNGAPTI